MYYVLHKLLFQATYYTYTGGGPGKGNCYAKRQEVQSGGWPYPCSSISKVASLSLLEITGTFFIQLAVNYHLIHLFGAIAHKHAAAQ